MFSNLIRCNKCLIGTNFVENNNAPFSLTQCGHVFCYTCIREVLETQQCSECGNVGAQSMPLTDPLPGAVGSLFDSIPDELGRVSLACRFQNSQMVIYFERLDKLEKKYLHLKQAYSKISQEYEKLKQILDEHVYQRQAQLETSVMTENTPFSGQFGPEYSGQTPAKSRVRFRHHGYATGASNASTSTARGRNTSDQPTRHRIFKIPLPRRPPRSKKSHIASNNGTHSSGGK